MNRNSDYPFIGGGRRSTVAGTGGGPHRRQQHQQDVDGGDIDPLESMREQFDRDRDAFFEGGSNGGVSGPTRHQSLFGMPQGADPFFSRVRQKQMVSLE